MTEKDSSPFTPPEVQDRRLKPPGLLPRNAQAWFIGGLALLMVLVIAFSGGKAPKERNASTGSPAPTAVDPSQARIQEYRVRIEEQARKLQLEQAQLARTKQALGLAPQPSVAPSGQIGSNQSDPAGSYPRPGYASSYASAQPSPVEDWIQKDKTKRDYESLFASNLALSYRNDGAAREPFATVPPQEDRASNRPDGNEPTRKSGPQKEHLDLNQAEGKEYRLFEGTVLETVLTNRLDGSFSGPVNCMVTTNVYAHDRQRLLIPQGSRVLGEIRKVETFGQQRLAVSFHRLIMPDGYSVSLDKFQGLSQVGETGLRDQVNHHYLQVFGVSVAIGAIAGLAQANTRYGAEASAEDAYRQGVATSLSQSSLRILDRYLNVLPTFTIREGHRVKIYLSNDLLLPAYENHRMPTDL